MIVAERPSFTHPITMSSEVILAASEAMLTAPDRTTLLAAIARYISEFGVDTYSLLRFCGSDKSELELIASWNRAGAPNAPIGTRFASTHFPTTTALSAGVALFFEDLATDQRLTNAARQLLVNRYHTRASASFPLVSQGEMIGCFSLSYHLPHRFTEAERQFFGSLARLCAVALANLLNREQLTAQTQRLHKLYQLSETIAGSTVTSEDELLQMATRLLVEDIGYATSWVGLVDHGAGVLRGRQGSGRTMDTNAINATYPLAETGHAAIAALARREPTARTNIKAIAQAEGWGALAEQANLNSTISTPLHIGGSVLGLLAVASSEDEVSPDEMAVLAAFGNHVTMALTRLRLDCERVQHIAELETAYSQQFELLETVRALSTPVIPIYDGVLVVPLVGNIDTARSAAITELLLQTIERERARVVILDITGVPVVDTSVANHLIQTIRAARLLGAHALLVGISPEVAQTMVQLGIDLSGVQTRSNLQAGFQQALTLLNRAIRVNG